LTAFLDLRFSEMLQAMKIEVITSRAACRFSGCSELAEDAILIADKAPARS
jgi:hypothetical protein